MESSSSLPDGALRRLATATSDQLASASMHDLVLEFRARLAAGAFSLDATDLADQLGLLGLEIEVRTESLWNRFSRTRVSSIAGLLAPAVDSGSLQLEGATIVDLGCGSIHPLGPSLLHVLGGAKLAVGIDLDRPQDAASASRALLRLALACLAAPEHVMPWARRTREQVLAALEGFDLAKLWLGDPTGIDARRLRLHHGAAEQLPFADATVDACTSVSFLEHVEDVDAALREMARVLRPGGVVTHTIDGVDHSSYGSPHVGPMDFLREPADLRLVGGCNRLRPMQFVERFERAGFEALAFEAHTRMPVDDAMRAGFAEPWRSMPKDVLEVTQGAVRARKKGRA